MTETLKHKMKVLLVYVEDWRLRARGRFYGCTWVSPECEWGPKPKFRTEKQIWANWDWRTDKL